MKILVNGTSVNIGPTDRPAQLQKKLNCEIVNLSRGYAGNTYIHDSTLNEISRRSYDRRGADILCQCYRKLA
jgi:hypothetical protein